jgi:hypothetical protein
MEPDNGDILEAINQKIERLHRKIDQHGTMVATALAGEKGGNRRQNSRFCPRGGHRNREREMKMAIQEAIEVLEESRKSFKSKRLEGLRKRLTQVLIDA